MPKKSEKFEDKLKRLEETAEKVENAPLDDAISLYKDGIELVKECGEILRGYEEQVMVLQKKAGEFILEPFAGA
jgi:exodeoxyribonuclease VII small subunit